VQNWASQITEMRNRNRPVRFTSPLFREDEEFETGTYAYFYQECGKECFDPSDPHFIDIFALNAFCGPWNIDPTTGEKFDCEGGAAFVAKEVDDKLTQYPLSQYRSSSGYDVPVFTNWASITAVATTDRQAQAMLAAPKFFKGSASIERVYWFGSRDFPENVTDAIPNRDNYLAPASVLNLLVL